MSLITGKYGLMDTECECGRTKQSRMSFCSKCFYTLPKPLRARLYKRVGEGYEEAHAEARAILKGDSGGLSSDMQRRGYK